MHIFSSLLCFRSVWLLLVVVYTRPCRLSCHDYVYVVVVKRGGGGRGSHKKIYNNNTTVVVG